jgi:hypothetical protein
MDPLKCQTATAPRQSRKVPLVRLGLLYENAVHPLTIVSTLPSAGPGALFVPILASQGPSMIGSIHAWSTIISAFLASSVEAVEALTVVLAVAVVRGWRSALLGTLAALCLLVALVAIFGRALGQVPISVLQLVVGVLLLLFGMRWLR